jgi:hypothetical protein
MVDLSTALADPVGDRLGNRSPLRLVPSVFPKN